MKQIKVNYIPTYDEVVVLDAYCNCREHDELIYHRQRDVWECCDCGGIV
jgi:hypothetical protein